MSAIAADLSPAERAERRAFLRRLRDLPPRSSADVVPIGSQRKPLGLRPAPGDDDGDASPKGRAAAESFSFHFAVGKDRAHLDNAVSASLVYQLLDVVGGALLEVHNDGVDELNDLQDRLARKFGELENTIGKLQNENQALRLILENLRITQRGERGIDGDRGPPGRDGRDGEGRIGPAGPRGDRGKDAPAICAWALDDANFSATPILSDGGNGAVLHLRGMFESFNDAINAADDDAERDAARAQRDAVEREVRAQGR
jgi:hypothetical protein